MNSEYHVGRGEREKRSIQLCYRLYKRTDLTDWLANKLSTVAESQTSDHCHMKEKDFLLFLVRPGPANCRRMLKWSRPLAIGNWQLAVGNMFLAGPNCNFNDDAISMTYGLQKTVEHKHR